MKPVTLLFFLLCSSLSLAQTQVEMNNEAQQKFQLADSMLSATYQQVVSNYIEDSVFINNLKESQHSWMDFRDAELKMKYPDREIGWYGSNHNMCLYLYKSELTTNRIATLQKWLADTQEGDGCAGSVK